MTNNFISHKGLKKTLILLVWLLGFSASYAQLTVTTILDSIDCYGQTAEVEVNVVGGDGTYNYYLIRIAPPGQTIQNAVNSNSYTFTGVLPTANYFVYVEQTSNPGIFGSSAAFSVSEPPELTNSAITVHKALTCYDGSDGELIAYVEGGTEPYSYSWNNGAAAGQIDSIATGIPRGAYSVDITDAKGCGPESPAIFWLSHDSIPPQLFITDASTTNTCEGSSSGTLTITGSGGTTPLDYAIVRVSDSDSTVQDGNNVFNGLSSGFYSSYVIDDRGCYQKYPTNELVDSVPQPIAPTMDRVPDIPAVCRGQNLVANINTNGSDGQGCTDTYEYRINGGPWVPYTPGNNIITVGASLVEVKASRGSCTAGFGCTTAENIYSWTVNAQPVAPILDKSPNETDVCEGQNVSASLNTAGTGGTGCTDSYEFSIDGGAWNAYTLGTNIPTAGVSQVQIRSINGSCDASTGCIADTNTYTWDVQPQPVAAVLDKSPNLATVCDGQSVSASLNTAGTGGVGCTDVYEYRIDGGVWQAYTLGNAIATAGVSTVDIRSTRGSCTGGVSCTPDENTYSWTIVAQPVASTFDKSPNAPDVCEGQDVSATINTAGTGGDGCSDTYEYRVDGGAWNAYTPGNNIATLGAALIELRSRREGCTVGAGCTDDEVNYSWNVIPQPIAPTLTKSPNLATVCDGQDVSASLNVAGSGGVGCSNTYEYRTDGGAWLAYTLGTDIATAGISTVDIRSYRSGCTPGLSCDGDTNTYSWSVSAQPVAPTMNKTPNTANVCEGQDVSAATLAAGTGGTGCSDIYEYRTDGGAWQAYVPGSNISTTGFSLIEVRSRRGSCTSGAGCTEDENIYSWNVLPQPVAPVLNKVPNVTDVCEGHNISATLNTAGTDGVGCSDSYEYRTDGGAWLPYTLGNNIATAGVTTVDIRATRGGCTPGLSCSSDENTYSWNVQSQPVAPVLDGSPVSANVCEGQNISATLNTAGSGGVGCSDTYEYRTDGGAWQAYTLGSNIATAGVTTVDIRATRGGCNGGVSCSSDENTYSWTVIAQPVAPVLDNLPASANVCEGQNVSATLNTVGTGGIGCSDTYEYRVDGGAWLAYTLGNNIATAGVSTVDIRATRGGCTPGLSCTSDENTYSWTVQPQPVAATLDKSPNVSDVCDGQNVSATLNIAGSGGVGCSDTYEYRTDGGAWQAYTLGTNIATTGLSSVDIRATRGSCTGGLNCSSDENTYSWTIQPQPVAPTMTKTPNVTDVCEGQAVSAAINAAGTGGVGCSDTYEYRTDGGVWNAYIPGSNIATAGISLVEIRATRGSCTVGLNCTSDENTYSWNVQPAPAAATLNKSPNANDVCDGQNISATLNTAGTGGVNCTDTYEYRVDGGAWQAYTLGDNIATTGLSTVDIRATRGGCDPGLNCTSDENIYSWTIQPQPVAPTMDKTPNVTDVCEGQAVSAAINTAGIGGVGCSDSYEYRIDGGAWLAYTIGNNISTTGVSTVDIRATRGGCAPGLGCTSDENIYSWTVQPQPVAPTMTKTPNVTDVCEGQAVSAAINVAGTGGVGCSDTYEYRTDGGAWLAYTPGSNIATAGISLVEVRATRGNCSAGLNCTSDENTYSWNVQSTPVAPTLNKVPDANDVCEGQNISATLNTAGSGGVGCSDSYEYRIDGGAWLAYTLGNAIPTIGVTTVDIRATRGGCTAGIGCTSDENIYTWTIQAQPVAPTMVKTPDVTDVCDGQDVSAAINTAGTGGVGCSDTYEYRTDGGAWLAYTPGSNISTTGITLVEIRASRGTCAAGVSCVSDENTYSWNVQPAPVAPVLDNLPASASVCEGQNISATLNTAGSGGVGCSDSYEYRVDGGAWQAYILGSNIATAGVASVDIRATRGGCTPGLNCTSDENMYSWTVEQQPVAPTLNLSPNSSDVCEGQNISATLNTAGTGGVGCSDVFEYRVDGGAWQAYTLGDNIATLGVSSVDIRATRGGCTPALSCVSDENTYNWTIQPQPTAPILDISPNLTDICEGQDVSATLNTAGSGGVSCTDSFAYRINGGAWQSYNLGDNISTTGASVVEIRAMRGDCTSGLSCVTDENIYTWSVQTQPVAPVLTKSPNQLNVCEGDNLSASLTTPGSGGDGCSNSYFYRIDAGAWLVYTPGNNISSMGVDSVEVMSIRGGCTPTAGCNADTNFYKWIVNVNPNSAAGPDADACGLMHTLVAAPSVGIGIWSQVSGPGTVDTWFPSANSSFAQVTVTDYGVYEFEWREDNNGCIDADTVEVTFHRAPESEAGSNATICYDSVYTITDADTNYSSSITWTRSGDGVFDDENIIAPTYTPGPNDLANGTVTLYLTASSAICIGVTAVDSMILTIPQKLQVDIGGEMPFPIGATTKITVDIEIEGNHYPNMDLSYYLVSPDGTQRVTLHESFIKDRNPFVDPGLTCIGGAGRDVSLRFTTDRPATDTLEDCGWPGQIIDTVNASGDWSNIYGLNPAEGGWSIEVTDHLYTNLGDVGNITKAVIEFADDHAVTGFYTPIIFNSGDTIIPLNASGSAWPTADTTRFKVPAGLRVSCPGQCDARAIAIVQNGTMPYVTFDWSPNVTSGNGRDTVDLCADTYTLTVTDALGCQATSSVVVTEPEPIIIDTIIYSDTLQCFGDSSGYITVVARQRDGIDSIKIVSPFERQSESADSGIFTGLPAGSFQIQIYDRNGCDSLFTVDIAQRSVFVFDTIFATSQVLCSGDSTGGIEARVNGGTLPYTYRLEPWGIENDSGIFAGLTAGEYWVKIWDAYNCDTLTSDTVSTGSPTLFSIDSVYTDSASCAGLEGTINFKLKGGAAPYRFQIDNDTIPGTIADTNWNAYNIIAGNYTFIAYDTNWCVDTVYNVLVEEPTPIIISDLFVSDTLNCFGDTSGVISIKATGGRGTLRVVLQPQNDTSAIADSGYYANLGAGTYTIHIVDSMNCTLDSVVTIEHRDSIGFTANTRVTDSAWCVGDANGRIVAEAFGGVGAYTYVLQPGNVEITSSDSAVYAGLDPGTYFVKVVDANGCDTVTTDSLIVGTSAAFGFSAGFPRANGACWGETVGGTIDVKVDGDFTTVRVYYYVPPNPPFNPVGFWQNYYDINHPSEIATQNFAIGTWDIKAQIYDPSNPAKECADSVTGLEVMLQNPQYTVNSVTSYADTTSCYQQGTIIVDATGTDSLYYSLDEFTGYTPNNIFTGLKRDTNYTVHVRDTFGCQIDSVKAIVAPQPMDDTIEVVSHVQGSIPAIVRLVGINGIEPYSYYINNILMDTSYVDTLSVGSYNFRVEDVNGCTNGDTTINIENRTLNVVWEIEDTNSCDSPPDVTLRAHINTGTPPYEYFVGSTSYGTHNFIPPTTINFPSLSAGNYQLRVVDADLNQSDTIITIVSPPPVDITIDSVVHPSCTELSIIDTLPSKDGYIRAIASGGNGVFTYSWNNGTYDTINEHTELEEGLYTVMARDSNGCETSYYLDTVLYGIDSIIPRVVAQDTTPCQFDTVTLSAWHYHTAVGAGTYDYSWMPDSLITDQTYADTIQMRFPTSTTVSVAVSTDKCINFAQLLIQPVIVPKVEVTVDADPNIIHGDTIYAPDIVRDENDLFTLSADVSSFDRHEWYWTPLSLGVEIFPPWPVADLVPSTVSIFETDIQYKYWVRGYADVCYSTSDTTYVILSQPVDKPYSGFTPNADGYNDTWSPPNAEMNPNIDIKIFNRWGQMVWTNGGSASNIKWDGRHYKNGKDLPMGTYYFVVVANDGTGSKFTGTVTLIR